MCTVCVQCVLRDPGLVQKLTLLSKAAQHRLLECPAGLCTWHIPRCLSGQLPSVHVSKLSYAHIIYTVANVVPSPLPPAALCRFQFLLPKLTRALLCVAPVTYNCVMCAR